MRREVVVAVSVMGLGLSLSACGSESGPALIDEKVVRWQLYTETLAFKAHTPSDPGGFEVECNISGGRLDFTMSAPKVESEKRPRSVLSVRQASPTADTCIVNIAEAPKFGEGEYKMIDTCKGTDPEGGCVLGGNFDANGWDFDGTLSCTKLLNDGRGAFITLYDATTTKGPMRIRLDNCD